MPYCNFLKLLLNENHHILYNLSEINQNKNKPHSLKHHWLASLFQNFLSDVLSLSVVPLKFAPT